MSLVLLIGGARSGKSQLALRMAAQRPAPVTFLATAQPREAEMAARVARHRAERPSSWRTIEEPLELAEAIAGVEDETSLIVDCLTLWTAQALEVLSAEEVERRAAMAADAAAQRRGLTVVVTNEVGLGIVPENRLARDYRDVLGRVNAIWAQVAAHALLVIAGRALELVEPHVLMDGPR